MTQPELEVDLDLDLGPGLAPEQLLTYFALTEVVDVLQHHVEQQLRADGDLSKVQFLILARLAAAGGVASMTQLADGVVYSRSGLTYQAGLLEKSGCVRRCPSPDDERSTLLVLTKAGFDRLKLVMPGHVEVVKSLLFASLSDEDVARLGDIMTRVRDHIRARPPRSAAPRRRRAAPDSDA